jgi:hypothetical protein
MLANMTLLNIITIYLFCGIIFNLIYDLMISGIKDESLRFNHAQRIGVTIVWPAFAVLFIINFIKTIFGNDKK